MALVALLLAAGSELAQEFNYTLEELEDKIDKSPRVKLLLASPGLDPGGGPSRSGTTSTSWAKLESHPDRQPIHRLDSQAGISASIPFGVFQPKSC